jgi:hypothetical protein
MPKMLFAFVLALAVAGLAVPAQAKEETVTLAVSGMT